MKREDFQKQYPHLHSCLVDFGRYNGPFVLRQEFDAGPTYLLGLAEEAACGLLQEHRELMLDGDEDVRSEFIANRDGNSMAYINLRLLDSWLDWILQDMWNNFYTYEAFAGGRR